MYAHFLLPIFNVFIIAFLLVNSKDVACLSFQSIFRILQEAKYNNFRLELSLNISNGNDGMRFSLVSRDVIADSIETVMGAQWYDGMIAVPGL